MQFWSPHHAKDIAKLETTAPRKNIERFKILRGFTNVDASQMFSIDNTSRTRSTGVKLRCKQVQLDCTKFFFTNDFFFYTQSTDMGNTRERERERERAVDGIGEEACKQGADRTCGKPRGS